MSHVREVSEILDLCSEQGFRVQKLERSGAWRVWPKTSNQQAVVIHDGRSRSSSQTKYLNTRSALRRIGVNFPEIDGRQQKPKEAETMQRPIITVPNHAPAQVPTVARDAISVAERMSKATENFELAFMELQEAQKEFKAVMQPLLAMDALVRQIRG